MSTGGRLWPWHRDPAGWERRCLAGGVGIFAQERGLGGANAPALRGAWSSLTEAQRQDYVSRADAILRASYQEELRV